MNHVSVDRSKQVTSIAKGTLRGNTAGGRAGMGEMSSLPGGHGQSSFPQSAGRSRVWGRGREGTDILRTA